ncbi:MAG: FAD-binding protein [Oscillospiraceae bacterium]|nr:FAD-binding protein [Oscillospiraceae bacterium]
MREINKVNCDVLIIGGGVGGLACALDLKEKQPEADVLVVEKNFAGYSGKANRGGGVLQYFELDRITPEEFVGFHATQIGAFLGDQELMMRYVATNHEMLDKLVAWGVNVPKKEDGTYHVMPTGPFTSMICVDLDITLRMRRRAQKLGIRFMDKTAMADILTKDGRAVGATAFSVLDGSFYAISAAQVVLATGSQNYRIGSMWSSGRGDGIAAAYRAGAQMRNAEFGNFAQLVRVKSHNEIVFGENFMYNAKGEHITKNFTDHRETDINSTAIREWYYQMKNGNGPVHLDFGPPPPQAEGGGGPNMERMWNRPYGVKFRKLNDESGNTVDRDLEVCPMFIGEQSPIKVDHGMRTTVDGLYAIGDCSYCGSALAGAVPAPPGRNRGSGILNAVFAALQCAASLSEAYTGKNTAEVCMEAAEKSAEELYKPMERTGGAKATDVVAIVQKAMAPVEQSIIMTEERMAKGVKLVEEAKELAKTLCADDWHALLNCREAEAAVLSAEMHYKASAVRKESRGWFMREDYPQMDNKNWLKWVIVQKGENGMEISTEDVPIDKWPVKPQDI